jgi:hypothetical protein
MYNCGKRTWRNIVRSLKTISPRASTFVIISDSKEEKHVEKKDVEK